MDGQGSREGGMGEVDVRVGTVRGTYGRAGESTGRSGRWCLWWVKIYMLSGRDRNRYCGFGVCCCKTVSGWTLLWIWCVMQDGEWLDVTVDSVCCKTVNRRLAVAGRVLKEIFYTLTQTQKGSEGVINRSLQIQRQLCPLGLRSWGVDSLTSLVPGSVSGHGGVLHLRPYEYEQWNI